MIRRYSDHAATERTFLAWVRTGIAIVVFGFVIEKFNLFLLAMANVNAVHGVCRMMLGHHKRTSHDSPAFATKRVQALNSTLSRQWALVM